MAEVATPSGPAVYFDGVTSALRPVTVACGAAGLGIRDADGNMIAEWPYARLAHLNAPAHIFRIGLRNSDALQRLEIEDRDLTRAIDHACPNIERTDAAARAERRGVLILSFAAIASLLSVAIYGLPQIADRVGRLLPPQIEQSLGRAADARFRAEFDEGPEGMPFECGTAPGEAEGKRAFDKLMSRIEQAAGLHIPIQAVVVRRDEANAFSLAGGHVYVLRGLIDNARNVDEVAAIIAHELGHIANRDGVRSVLQSAGLSLIFGMLLGDFVGGAAVVGAAWLLLHATYSRRQEAAADDYAIRTLQALKVDPRALATFLGRVAVRSNERSLFRGHPPVSERVARINANAPRHHASEPLLDPDEWQALRRICAGHS